MVDNFGDKRTNVVPIKRKKCPTCARSPQQEFRPFCSKRCADLDLGMWLNEDYRIPAEEGSELDDDAFKDN